MTLRYKLRTLLILLAILPPLVTPAMGAGLADKVWTVAEMIEATAA